MSKGKRVKPRFSLEYRILLTQKFDAHEKKNITLVGVRTINEFQNFLYEIAVAAEVRDRTVRIEIKGLRAPQVTIPGTGPARFSLTLPELRGAYQVIIAKLDREENIYEINVTGDNVTIAKSPQNKFAELVTREQEW
jgi:hypothetical protein